MPGPNPTTPPEVLEQQSRERQLRQAESLIRVRRFLSGNTLLQAVARERAEQLRRGHTVEHDDRHHVGQLAQAAACYALPMWARDGGVPYLWPWRASEWKPSVTSAWSGLAERRHELAKAGALLLAEWERLDRLAGLESTDGLGGRG